MYISLSPQYAIRNEGNCSYLIYVAHVLERDGGKFDSFCIPPFMGYILGHIGDEELEKSALTLSKNLNIGQNAVNNFINQLINNTDCRSFKFNESTSFTLPPNLLIKSINHLPSNVRESEDFNKLGEYTIKRPQSPFSVNVMVTTRCTTDCIYCYANRNIAPMMNTNEILQIIDELHSVGVINVTLTGGDVFTRNDWRIILRRLRQYGYFPYLSTKTPLDEEAIVSLREMGYSELQFSLDSNNEASLAKLVNAPDNYLQKVKCFFDLADRHGLKLLIRSVLTRYNSEINSILDFYSFLAGCNSVKEWSITPAFFSKYKDVNYREIEVPNEALKEVHAFSRKHDLKFPIILNKISKEGYHLKGCDRVEDFVLTNQICVANTTGISILANGDCTVCEMLYEDEDFLLGNILKCSIKDIWNSNKALELYHLNQQSIDPESPCQKCPVFSDCRTGYGKRICYLDIKKAGKALSFPDPRCPKAEEIDLIL